MNEFVKVKISHAYYVTDPSTGILQVLFDERSKGTRGPGSTDDIGRVIAETIVGGPFPRSLAILADAVLWCDENDDRFDDPQIAECEGALISAAKSLRAAWEKWDRELDERISPTLDTPLPIG